MSLSLLLVLVLGVALLVGSVALILLWAFTEELPRMREHVPLHERLEAGPWGVRLLAVGRRRMRTMRLINELLGGDIGAAKHMVDNAPTIVIEGISEPLAQEVVTALQSSGAQAELFRDQP